MEDIKRTVDGFMYRRLQQLAGIRIIDSMSLSGSKKILISYKGSEESCQDWFDQFETAGAQVLGTYSSEYLDGTPVITRNDYGKGAVLYIGTVLAEKTTETVISNILSDFGWEADVQADHELMEVIYGSAVGEDYVFVINHDYDKEHTIRLSRPLLDVRMNEMAAGEVSIGRMDYGFFKLNETVCEHIIH